MQIDLSKQESFSKYLFGHNIEHTRACVEGGLSAQLIRNRKFAGKPSKNCGCAREWFPIGERAFFRNDDMPYTKHVEDNKMLRRNELQAQVIQGLCENGVAGIGQKGICLRAGIGHQFRVVAKVPFSIKLSVEFLYSNGSKCFEHTFDTKGEDWRTYSIEFTPEKTDIDCTLKMTFEGRGGIVFGAVSLMPNDNFHGMRRDVVELLKEIGATMLRWPGGNYAGDYRWRDGMLEPDMRGPIQAFMEDESQPYTYGFDNHEINTDDFISLCKEVGAEPFITFNFTWDSAEDCANWVEYCNGDITTEYGKLRAERGHADPYNVKFWSLGNELGLKSMEGTESADKFISKAKLITKAVREITPDVTLVAPGEFSRSEFNGDSLEEATVNGFSLHVYTFSPHNYTTDEKARKTYYSTLNSGMERIVDCLSRTRSRIGDNFPIFYDEWNCWYSWYRQSSVTEGLFIAEVLHYFLKNSNLMNMPVSCYFEAINEGCIIVEPDKAYLTANGQMFGLMSNHVGGKICLSSEQSVASVKDDILTITLINREYDEDKEFRIDVCGEMLNAKLYYSEDVLPGSVFNITALSAQKTEQGFIAKLPKHSAAIIQIKL